MMFVKEEPNKHLEGQINNMIEKKGICPVCGSDKLDYGVIELDGESIWYPWECKNKDCGATGRECYNLEFIEHVNVDRNK